MLESSYHAAKYKMCTNIIMQLSRMLFLGVLVTSKLPVGTFVLPNSSLLSSVGTRLAPDMFDSVLSQIDHGREDFSICADHITPSWIDEDTPSPWQSSRPCPMPVDANHPQNPTLSTNHPGLRSSPPPLNLCQALAGSPPSIGLGIAPPSPRYCSLDIPPRCISPRLLLQSTATDDTSEQTQAIFLVSECSKHRRCGEKATIKRAPGEPKGSREYVETLCDHEDVLTPDASQELVASTNHSVEPLHDDVLSSLFHTYLNDMAQGEMLPFELGSKFV